jgi:hypothetical protein
MKVFIIDPGRFDPLTAYAAVNTLRVDDMNPHIYRTHDGGKSWKEIVDGIPAGAPVSVVREDPKQKGLLFAGSETQVYVSFDDGDHWQSLRLNMAPSSVRDLIVKDDDLVVGTHGRGIWILDNITPLRQLAEFARLKPSRSEGQSAEFARLNPSRSDGQVERARPERNRGEALAERPVILFKPQTAYRVRWNMNTDTPLPPDEPAAPNPPEGAIIDYYLKSPASGPVTLEILGADGKPVRKYSSTDRVFTPDPATVTVPLYWFRPLRALPSAAGMHRVTWDLHYQPLPRLTAEGDPANVPQIGGPNLPIAAVGNNTVPAPTTPWVNPGRFTVRLTVDGQTYTQPLTVRQDPRVRTPAIVMDQVYSLSKAMYYEALDASNAFQNARKLRDDIAIMRPQTTGAIADALAAFDAKLANLTQSGDASESLATAVAMLSRVMNLLQQADVRPTTVQLNAIAGARTSAAQIVARWRTLRTVDLPALNARLTAAGLRPLAIDSGK